MYAFQKPLSVLMIYDIGYLQNIFLKILNAEAKTNELKCSAKPTLT